jgi:parvulin-like peptidyl-prolyl isomerase
MPSEPGKKPVLHTKKHVARLERERQQTRLILYLFIAVLASVLLLLGYGFLDIKYLQLNKPVAKIGDVQIIEKDFEARVRLQRQQLMVNYTTYTQYQQMFGIDTSQQLQQISSYLNTPELLGQSVLDQMVNEELIRQEAAKRNITASPAEIDEYIRAQLRYFPNGTYTPTVTPTEVFTPVIPEAAFKLVTRTPTLAPTSQTTDTPTSTIASQITGTPASNATPEPTASPTATLAPSATATTGPTATIPPTSTITPTATPYTLDAFQNKYKTTLSDFEKWGFTEAGYRKLVEIQILQSKLKDVIDANVSHAQEQIWARHILVKDPALAAQIIERLKAGEDFAALAVKFSTDTGSAPKGGDLGWFGKGAMVPEFEAAAFALKNPGDYTPVAVKSQFGYHIIQLIARQDRPLSASDYDKARTTAFSDWLTSIRKNYKIETYDVWKTRVPLEPNFSSVSTESAQTAAAQPTATP